VSVGVLKVEGLDVPGNNGFARDGLQQVDSVRDFDPGDRGGFIPVLGVPAAHMDPAGQACGFAQVFTLAAVARVPKMLEPLSLLVLVD